MSRAIECPRCTFVDEESNVYGICIQCKDEVEPFEVHLRRSMAACEGRNVHKPWGEPIEVHEKSDAEVRAENPDLDATLNRIAWFGNEMRERAQAKLSPWLKLMEGSGFNDILTPDVARVAA